MFWSCPEDWLGAEWQPGSGDMADESVGGTAVPEVGADAWIADRAVVALGRDPAVRGHRLEILVQNRVVILLGDVDSTSTRSAAGRRAWKVPGVFDIANCLTVRGSIAGFEDGPR